MDTATRGLVAATISIFREPKEIMIKEVKKAMMTISHQIENINEKKLQKRNQVEILKL